MFCEHLADADDAALMRLVIMYMLWRHPFGGVSFLSSIFPARKRGVFMAAERADKKRDTPERMSLYPALSREGRLKNRGRPWPREREGPNAVGRDLVFQPSSLRLLVKRSSNVNSASNCTTYHRVVTDAEESHHLNVCWN